MRKTVRQTLIDFLEDKGLYDLYGREPGKLTYNDVVELTDRLFDSEEFVDSEETETTIEGLQDDVDMAQSESEEYYDKLNRADYELKKLIDSLSDSEYLYESRLVNKLKEIREDMDV